MALSVEGEGEMQKKKRNSQKIQVSGKSKIYVDDINLKQIPL